MAEIPHQVMLHQAWAVGALLGSGGFGEVHLAESEGDVCVVKFIPKEVGARRELLFVDLEGVRNVIPVLDHGETDDFIILLMPRAEKSLAKHISDEHEIFEDDSILRIIGDLAEALVDLESKGIVHRDIKPDNVLLFDKKWRLADFGISRYVEDSTSVATRKFAMSLPYAAPERWLGERAEIRTDIYSVGILAYELLTGGRPFSGPTEADFYEQHLHGKVPVTHLGGTSLRSLINECLMKAVEARPSPKTLLNRIGRAQTLPESPEIEQLRRAHEEVVSAKAEQARLLSERVAENDRSDRIFKSAVERFEQFSQEFKQLLVDAAPSIIEQPDGSPITQPANSEWLGWNLQLGEAYLSLSNVAKINTRVTIPTPTGIRVIAFASITLHVPEDSSGWRGRSHSLWFCDCQVKDEFMWYETAFADGLTKPSEEKLIPRSEYPGPSIFAALENRIGETQLVRPFVALSGEGISDFNRRWIGWFASATRNELKRPSRLPELELGTWRR